MTAEIVVMNKSAVALAADSAVTIQNISGQKVYNAVNKLFALSKYHPVGVMIYGSADFMGIPWESIIKIYRKQLGHKPFEHLSDYAEDFISFLDKKNGFIVEDYQDAVFFYKVESYFRSIAEEIKEQVKQYLDKEKEILQAGIISLSLKIITEHLERWNQSEALPHLPKDFPARIRKKYAQSVKDLIEKVFEKLPLSDLAKESLQTIAYSTFSKSLVSISHSGIVIAGFGESDIFPSTRAFQVENLLLDRLKYKSESGGERRYFS